MKDSGETIELKTEYNLLGSSFFRYLMKIGLQSLRNDMEQDFLDEMIEESTKRNPDFPTLMEEARQRRALLSHLAAIRSRSKISQKTIAKRIKTSQPAIARLEAGIVNPRLSTLQRYAASVGKRIEWTLVDA